MSLEESREAASQRRWGHTMLADFRSGDPLDCFPLSFLRNKQAKTNRSCSIPFQASWRPSGEHLRLSAPILDDSRKRGGLPPERRRFQSASGSEGLDLRGFSQDHASASWRYSSSACLQSRISVPPDSACLDFRVFKQDHSPSSADSRTCRHTWTALPV